MSFRFLRSQVFFQKLEKKKYILFCDTGPHFRNAQILHYFFNEIASEGIQVK